MANNIALAENYQRLLDKKYKKSSITADLEVKDEMTRGFDDAGTVQILSVVTDGLGNYDRESGFASGSTTAAWTPYTIDFDRSQSFEIDAMDDAEAKGMVFVSTAREFMDNEVIPEVDATRFARMASRSASSIEATLADGDAFLAAIDAGELKMNDDEVPEENRVIYLSNEGYSLLKNASKITRQFDVDENGNRLINRSFEMLDNMRVVRVPKTRFYTEIDLNDGTGDVWGYSKSATGAEINFMIVHKPAVKAVTRHKKVRIFDADTNQGKDADKYQYRIYHDLIVPDNKTAGLYTHKKPVV